MKLYIPEIGDRIELLEDWTFKLYNESRNKSVIEALQLKDKYTERDQRSRSVDGYDATLLKGTVLTVDRIYIRNGNKDYSSLSFIISSTHDERFVSKKGAFGSKQQYGRFWAKLEDVNQIEYRSLSEATKAKLGIIEWTENQNNTSTDWSYKGEVNGETRFTILHRIKTRRPTEKEINERLRNYAFMDSWKKRVDSSFINEDVVVHLYELFDKNVLVYAYSSLNGAKKRAKEILKKEHS